MMNCPVLRVSSNEGKYSEYPLKRGLNLIGRSYSKLVPDENYHYIGIITEDTKISRKHCFIEWEINDNQESFLLLYDNISINGTMLKGFKKEILDKDDMIYLINQDEIILGDKALLILDYLLKFKGDYVSTQNLEKGAYTLPNTKGGFLLLSKYPARFVYIHYNNFC